MPAENFFEDEQLTQELEDITPNEEGLPESEDYEFVTGDLNTYVQDFQEPKEDMGVDMRPTDEEFQAVHAPTIPKKVARNTGRFITTMIDQSASRTLSMLSGQPYADHKADPEELKALEEIITLMVQESGGELPLWAQLCIALVTTYGLQVYPAWQKMKEKKQNKK